MAFSDYTRVFFACFLLGVVAGDVFRGLNDVTLQAFKPKGFRASIPDIKHLSHFAIQGFTKRGFETIDVQGETASPVDRRWVVDLPHVQLNIGDELSFLAFAAVNTSGYVRDNIEYTVTELRSYVPLNPSPASIPTLCEPTVTRVRHGFACAGHTIFEEHFDFLRDDVWQVQQYVPIVDHPELPFVSYQPSAVSVKDGNLRIVPSLQQAQPGYAQTNNSLFTQLDLNDGCTKDETESCSVRVEDGYPIIPPVISGRLISKPGFAFTYGTISIRAKLPQGDWIYPELLLEPLIKKFTYGTRNSGMVKIACTRGNKDLYKGSKQYGNKVLYSGPVIDTRCHNSLLLTKISEKSWGESFHVYSAKWTKKSLVFSVDGEEYATVKPEPSKGLRMELPNTCKQRAEADTGMKPFDEYFYITLGLAVGGRSEFPDASVSEDNHDKPWRNVGSKATIDFWKDKNVWFPTWQLPELLVDYVKVVAL